MRRLWLAGAVTLTACVLCASALGLAWGAQDYSLGISKVDVQGFPDVKLYVSFLDPAGESIKGLARADFAVSEDGTPMSGLSLESLRKSGEQVSIVLLVDCSYSMRDSGALEQARSGARGFIDIMDPKDECTVISVSDRITPRLVDSAGRIVFSSDKGLLKAAVDSIGAEPFTRLYDGLALAIQSVGGTASLRRIVVVLTDALPSDERSTATLAACVDAAAMNDVTIHAIGEGSDVNPGPLVEMARATGGSYYFAAVPGDLIALYQRILANIYNEYIVRYTSPIVGTEALKTHRAEVSVTHGGATYRATASFVPQVIPARHSAAGIILIVLAILALIGLSAHASWRRTQKPCPSCGKLMPLDAMVCPHCRFDFGASKRFKEPIAETETQLMKDDSTRIMHKRRAYAWLTVTEGTDAGKTYEVADQGVTSVGRSSENDIVLDDGSVSRSHAKIQADGGRYVIHDLASANGTLVSGETVDVAEIADGTTIQLGDEVLSFQVTKKEEDSNDR